MENYLIDISSHASVQRALELDHACLDWMRCVHDSLRLAFPADVVDVCSLLAPAQLNRR